jgi:hypothetical protein
LLGWIHSVIANVALLAGLYTLAVYKVITPIQITGQVYLVCTTIAAVTALMTYKHGRFGAVHFLAILTLLALVAGFLVTKITALFAIADYFRAFCFSGTLLFHMIPAITDGLLRLPVSGSILTNPEDSLLKQFYLSFVVIFLVGYICQFVWLKNHKQSHAA